MGIGIVKNFSKNSNEPGTTDANDQALWRSSVQGNELAFSSLYTKYANPLFNYGMHLCYDRELVKDCLQELFAYLWNRRESLLEVNSVKFYLFKSFRNRIFKALEKDKGVEVELEWQHENLHVEASQEEEIITQEIKNLRKEQLDMALTKLSKRQREIVLLKFFNEMSYAQLSSVMEISVASAQNLLSKALQLLRLQLRES